MSLGGVFTSLEQCGLEASYRLGKSLNENLRPSDSRVTAVAVPTMCLVGEAGKLLSDCQRLLSIAYGGFAHQRLTTGNIQTGIMHFCEHLRNITGVLTGLFVGLYSPATANSTFLVCSADRLKTTLTRKTAARLYALGQTMDKFLTKHDIDYRMSGGSMLGAVRHGGIIPWDDDIDLFLHPKDVERCRKLFKNGTFTQETGLVAQKQPFTGGWEVFHPDSKRGEGLLKDVGLPFVDVFATVYKGNRKRIAPDSALMRALFTEDHITVEEWEKPKRYVFGPTTLVGISDPHPYICRSFGSDALDYAYQTMHHEELADIWEHPFDLKGNGSKVWHYGLPRRAYITDTKPVSYSERQFAQDVAYTQTRKKVQQLDLAV